MATDYSFTLGEIMNQKVNEIEYDFDLSKEIGRKKLNKNVFDFQSFISPPQVPFDIFISNSSIGFGCHKNILKKISHVFSDLLIGDPNSRNLPLNDINDENLKLLQYLIYGHPKKRDAIFKHFSLKHEDLLNVLLLVSKYDIVIVQPVLKKYFDNAWFNISQAGELWQIMKQYNLNTMATMVFDNHTCEEYIEEYSTNFTQIFWFLACSNGKSVEIAIEIAKNLPTKKLSFKILQPWIQGLISYSIFDKDKRLKVIKDIILKKLSNSSFAPNEICEIMKDLWETCQGKFEYYQDELEWN